MCRATCTGAEAYPYYPRARSGIRAKSITDAPSKTSSVTQDRLLVHRPAMQITRCSEPCRYRRILMPSPCSILTTPTISCFVRWAILGDLEDPYTEAARNTPENRHIVNSRTGQLDLCAHSRWQSPWDITLLAFFSALSATRSGTHSSSVDQVIHEKRTIEPRGRVIVRALEAGNVLPVQVWFTYCHTLSRGHGFTNFRYGVPSLWPTLLAQRNS